jgi:heat shock protein HslJ
MEQEARFLDNLSNVQRWDFNDIGQLQLWLATGQPIRLWPEDN